MAHRTARLLKEFSPGTAELACRPRLRAAPMKVDVCEMMCDAHEAATVS
jgi:hypothetical protein